MPATPINPSSGPGNREIVSARVFDLPRDVVFRAFADASILARWWGPKGFTNSFEEFDLRPGGVWRFVMHSPDGTDYRIVKEFTEVVAPERIVLTHPEPKHRFQMTISFADEAGRTLLTWRMLFESEADAATSRDFIAEANEQNFDRLEAQLATMDEA